MTQLLRDFFKILHGSPNPVYATDEANRIIAWNRAAELLLGHRCDDAVGKKCYALIAGTDIYGNDFCDRECNVTKMIRRDRVVKRFDMDVRHASGDPLRVHCAILLVPGPSPSRFSKVHLFEVAGEPEPREPTSVPDGPRRPLPHSGNWTQLTPREQQVLRMLSTGASTQEIADSLFISVATARTHIHNILDKLRVHSRLEAVLNALKHNLI